MNWTDENNCWGNQPEGKDEVCSATLAGRIFCGTVPAPRGAAAVEGLQSGKGIGNEEVRGLSMQPQPLPWTLLKKRNQRSGEKLIYPWPCGHLPCLIFNKKRVGQTGRGGQRQGRALSNFILSKEPKWTAQMQDARAAADANTPPGQRTLYIINKAVIKQLFTPSLTVTHWGSFSRAQTSHSLHSVSYNTLSAAARTLPPAPLVQLGHKRGPAPSAVPLVCPLTPITETESLIGSHMGIPGKALPLFKFVAKQEYPISCLLLLHCIRQKRG